MPISSKFRRISVAALAIALSLFTVSAVADRALAMGGISGNVTGSVTDANGANVADVHVHASSPSGSFDVKTNGRGAFTLLGLPVDTYTLTFAKNGFTTQTLTGVSVLGDSTSNIGRIPLQAGT